MFPGIHGKALVFLVPLAVLFAGSCGLEDYPTIDPVPQASISQISNNRAEVRIPGSNTTAFRHYAIFYRIYVSKSLELSPAPVNYYSINPVLNSDFGRINSYIGSTTQVNVNMDSSVFTPMGYKYLYLQNYNIDTVLSDTVFGKTLIFDFPSQPSVNGVPTMTIDGILHTLWRSNGNGLFTPKPDRFFVNSSDLWNTDNISPNFNADVVNLDGITDADTHHSYAAMFIVAVGVDTNNYQFIYSTPALIHVFQLPDTD